ncbi:ABC transporter ATP-binding protein [Clostridium estertheticum]|uniref:ABC transporter ATP-binding protein n=1 Tax=Clostridium estertheticum TaxID=238834 RepID=A0AA47EEY4_9CLOT|nr:ABC transporter ATP-binding protein [Clostridium estertheticum]MBU3156506.1 ABC transporter ATP-binding protein [Clostridium estertheticum]MBU3215618.1 ABC transporter ATP-binding protein [Clostridium estertheticum]MBW9154419.1 ABC transporter ATP-binding protein [Clostridium estertheticum]MBW9172061.1 ABC transporter ATP-binding protein [Clostridium estertheticum]MBX4265024.1 ABC transporter ATP-binding protein [Clostridium estertheticum]
MPVLKVENLKKTYSSKNGGNRSKALNGISFEVEKGEFVGIMGPSGSGKSTLLNVIATIDEATSGSVIIGKQNINMMNSEELAIFRREKLGFIFQDYNLLDTMTLRENIALPLVLAKENPKIIAQRVEVIASALGIEELLGKYPYEVSGGQRQRASAARAMISNPELILADEPTGALDSKSSTELLQCLTDMNERNAVTILLVTHDAFTASYCKRILFIKDGTIFTEIDRGGSRKEFFDQILKVLAILGGDNRELL